MDKNEMKWRLAFMGKKKQLKKLAKANIKILRSGKLKIAKGEKLSLRPFIKDSIDNTIVSRLNGIISKEDVIVDTEDLRCDTTSNLTDELKTIELTAKVNSPKTQTVVVSLSKKNAVNAFDFIESNAIGVLMRTSTLASVYAEVRDEWNDLNKDKNDSFTNVLFIPKVMIFIDLITGKVRKDPIYINFLMVASPSVDKMKEEGIEEVTQRDATMRVIADTLDAAIKCGCKDLILYPYYNKITQADKTESGTLWHSITTSQKVIENIDSIIFTFGDENENDFITFNAAKNTVTV